MNKYLVEFIGTFFLVLTIGFAVLEPGAEEYGWEFILRPGDRIHGDSWSLFGGGHFRRRVQSGRCGRHHRHGIVESWQYVDFPAGQFLGRRLGCGDLHVSQS